MTLNAETVGLWVEHAHLLLSRCEGNTPPTIQDLDGGLCALYEEIAHRADARAKRVSTILHRARQALTDTEPLALTQTALRAAIAIETGAQDSDVLRARARHLALEVVMRELPTAMFWKDTNGFYLGANRYFAELTGYDDPSDLIGMHDLEMAWAPAEAMNYLSDDKAVTASRVAKLNIEESQRQADGSDNYLLTSKVPLLAEDGTCLGILGMFNDITERRHTELALEAAKREAERSAQVKDDFLATMSHEIRTPLALILAPLDELSRPQTEERQRQLIARIRRNAERLEELVNDILDFVRSRASALPIFLSPLDVAQFIRQLTDAHVPAAEARGLELTVRHPPSLVAMTDRKRLEKIVANLLSNALKFTPSGGRVTVDVGAADGCFVVEVVDTGPGIAPEHQERIFQRFQQTDVGAARRYEGTGLGLALVRELAGRLDGRVTLRSEVGQGSTFRVELPLAQGGASVPPPPADAAQKLRLPAEPRPVNPLPAAVPDEAWVLVVEDHAELGQQIAECLEPNHPVLTVGHGGEALALLAQAPRLPSAIVSDYMMPEVHGLELLRALRKDPRYADLPFIMLTAYGDDDLLARALEAGADDHVRKPFRPLELRARVSNAVRTRELQRELEEQRTEALKSRHWSNLMRVLAQTSHEINNPLTVILGNMELIEEWIPPALALVAGARALSASDHPGAAQLKALLDDPGIEDLELDANGVVETVLDAVARIQRIQRDLRVFLRGEQAEDLSHQPSEAVFDVGRVVQMTAQGVSPMKAPEVSVEVDIAGPLPVRGSHHQLGQVIHNLVINAIQALGDSGAILLRAKRLDGEVVLQVADDGPGLGQEVLAQCFEPFFTTKAYGLGTGLGLSVSRELIQGMGGRISVTNNTPEPGCTFTIQLPLAEQVPGRS